MTNKNDDVKKVRTYISVKYHFCDMACNHKIISYTLNEIEKGAVAKELIDSCIISKKITMTLKKTDRPEIFVSGEISDETN